MTVPVGALRRELLAHLHDPWFMDQDRLGVLASMTVVDVTETGLALPGAPETRATAREAPDGPYVAVIPLRGVITPRSSWLAMLFGAGGGLAAFRRSLAEAVASQDVSAIVLDVDSPGGLLDLVPETAAEIREARGVKPVVAVANTLCASAAYWIASQAGEVVVTPSGLVGSIGAYLMHVDRSKLAEEIGIKTTYISAGKYKTEANPYEPLSDEARAALQARVDDGYDMFVADVAAGRGASTDDVRAGFGEGRVLTANAAVDAGLADRVATLEEACADLAQRNKQSRKYGAMKADADAAAAAITTPTMEAQ